MVSRQILHGCPWWPVGCCPARPCTLANTRVPSCCTYPSESWCRLQNSAHWLDPGRQSEGVKKSQWGKSEIFCYTSRNITSKVLAGAVPLWEWSLLVVYLDYMPRQSHKVTEEPQQFGFLSFSCIFVEWGLSQHRPWLASRVKAWLLNPSSLHLFLFTPLFQRLQRLTGQWLILFTFLNAILSHQCTQSLWVAITLTGFLRFHNKWLPSHAEGFILM